MRFAEKAAARPVSSSESSLSPAEAIEDIERMRRRDAADVDPMIHCQAEHQSGLPCCDGRAAPPAVREGSALFCDPARRLRSCVSRPAAVSLPCSDGRAAQVMASAVDSYTLVPKGQLMIHIAIRTAAVCAACLVVRQKACVEAQARRARLAQLWRTFLQFRIQPLL